MVFYHMNGGIKMKRNDFMCQAALNLITLGITKHDEVERDARYITETMEEKNNGIFDTDVKGIFDASVKENTIVVKPYESIVIIPASQLRCNNCTDFESCQGRKANPLIGGPCPELKIAVIAKEL